MTDQQNKLVAILFSLFTKHHYELFMRLVADCDDEYHVFEFMQKDPDLFDIDKSKFLILLDEAKSILDDCNKKQIEILYPGHDFYPLEFYDLEKPPIFLSYQGELSFEKLITHRISVIGSRELSYESREWMNLHFDEFLKKSKCLTISGGARGADQTCHFLSIRNQLPTWVWLPSGLNEVYPQDILKWKASLLDAGGILWSEFLPNQVMRKFYFERRNRLIAALSDNLFVVEARRKSGSIMTAHLALNQGKQIHVLPHSPYCAQSLGGLDLIYAGASIVRDSLDLELAVLT